MIFWDEAGSIAFTLHNAGKNSEAVTKVRAICADSIIIPQRKSPLFVQQSQWSSLFILATKARKLEWRSRREIKA